MPSKPRDQFPNKDSHQNGWQGLTSFVRVLKHQSDQVLWQATPCFACQSAYHSDHGLMCRCHWYCTKHRLKHGIGSARVSCPQSAKSDSSKITSSCVPRVPWRQMAYQGDHDDHGSMCCCHWYCVKHRLKLPDSIAFRLSLTSADRNKHASCSISCSRCHASEPLTQDVKNGHGMSWLHPNGYVFITAACALGFFTSYICTRQFWPDLASADGSVMKTLSKELKGTEHFCPALSARQWRQTACHGDQGDHGVSKIGPSLTVPNEHVHYRGPPQKLTQKQFFRTSRLCAPAWRGEEALIITLTLHVCSSCFHACVYKKRSTRRWRLCSGPEPGTYSGKLRIWELISKGLHTGCICYTSMYCLFPVTCMCLTGVLHITHLMPFICWQQGTCIMQHILLAISCFWGTRPRCQKWSRHVLAPSQGLCSPSLLQDLTLISLFPKDMCILKIKHLTFHDKTFRRIAWTSSLPRAVEFGICKDWRQSLGLLWPLTWKVEETHVANTLTIILIITLIIALSKHPDHIKFACLLQLLLRMHLQEAISEGSVDRSQALTVENFRPENPFAYALYLL